MANTTSKILLPVDHLRQKDHLFTLGEQSISIPDLMLHELIQKEQKTVFSKSTILFAAYLTFIYRYSYQKEVSVCLVTHSRFKNIRFHFTEDMLFQDVLERLQIHIKEESNTFSCLDQRETTQLFFQSKDEQDFVDLRKSTGYDLSFVYSEDTEITFLYNRERFEDATVTRMMDNFLVLLQGTLSLSDESISNLPILSEAERNQLLFQFNGTKSPFPSDCCVHRLFEQMVCHVPNKIAVEFGNQHLTYRQLDQKANQLAHYLRKKGVKAGIKVAFCMERSLEMIISILGILKAGGTYVPLDPNFPVKRLIYMIEDSGSQFVLTGRSTENLLLSLNISFISWTELSTQINQESITPLELSESNEQTAYIIYTSGSTGKPKGVQISHRSFINFLSGMVITPGIHIDDRMLAMSTISFDISKLEIFLPLIVGATIVLITREIAVDGERLAEVIDQSRVTIMQGTPATWRLLIHSGWKGNSKLKILCGGESWTRELAKELQLRCAELWNMYGPTETTVWATAYHVEDNSPIYIGRPIINMETYVLDTQQQPVPLGVPGELYIGGEGVGQGYLNRPELNMERFLDNPFTGKGQIYRTGDLVRYLPDGNLECLGRLDHQVKVRGYRIELLEIEEVLLQHVAIREVVVVAYDQEKLVAYFVLESEASITNEELRHHCLEYLPEYMIPTFFIEMNKFPLTPSGKVDRRSLPKPDSSLMKRTDPVILPRTPLETRLIHFFSEILHVEEISIHDSFFALGGHSLLATQLISRIKNSMQVRVSMQTLFQLKSVAKLAEYIEQSLTHGQKNEEFPICSIEKDQDLRLSFAQQRLWFLQTLDPESTVYNMSTVLHLEGYIDPDAWIESIHKMVQRHESFRTIFYEIEGEPFQKIVDDIKVDIPTIHLEQGDLAQIHQLAKQLSDAPFNLSQGPLFRGMLVCAGERDSYLIWVVHHIISDGWSEEIFKQELVSLYRSAVTSSALRLEALPICYADYAHWQLEKMQGEKLRESLNYWKKQLDGAVPLLPLPTDQPRPPVQTFKGALHRFTVPQDRLEKIKQLTHQLEATMFMTLLAAFQTLLYRYSGQSDILVGSPIANRNHTEIENLIGFFVNTLVLRTDFSEIPTFEQLLAQVKDVALGAYEHQDVPFEKLVEELQPERNLSYPPLFQVMFVQENMPFHQEEIPGLTIRSMDFDPGTAKFDLTLFVTETKEGLVASFEYNTDLFDQETIERMAQHFDCLLESIATNPQQKVNKLNLLPEAERELLVHQWNRTQTELSKELVHERFLAIAKQVPDQIAVEIGEHSFTYQELNERAERLAHFLRGQGIGPDQLVGICMERSIEMMVGLLGIWKAGGAYVPLDPAYPPERLAFLLQDSQVTVLLTQEKLLERLPSHQAAIFCLDRDWSIIASCKDCVLGTSVQADSLAYMIYTSGSTGIPKGVMIPHRGLSNYLSWALDAYEVKEGIGSIVSSSLAFDATITSLYLPLLTGGRVILLPDGQEIEQLSQALRKHQNLSLLKITPAHLQLINQQLSSEELAGRVRTVVIGGEALLGENLAFWQEAAPETRFINEYGPTETVVGCSIYHASEIQQGPVLIGRPIANMQLYVLDSLMQPVPIGVLGELYIGGVALAHGYHLRFELTQERFVPHPFSNKLSDRLYRTGDIVRYRSDGNLEYLGRMDDQVKLRGYRIELGEIESILLQYPSVIEAKVIVREDILEDKRLVAYVINSQGHTLDVSDLRSYLTERVPSYMVPSAIVVLDELPLTVNGKVDQRLLPAPNQDIQSRDYVAPRIPMEEKLASIFASVLGVDRIGVYDHFFESGGHSLLVTQVISRIRSTWNVDLPVRSLFEAPNVEALAKLIEKEISDPTKEVALEPIARAEDRMPVSFAQQRLWFVDQLEGTSTLYNIVLGIHIRGELHKQALISALEEMIGRHEVLRTTFTEVDGEPFQVIHPKTSIQLPVMDVSEKRMSFESEEVQLLLRQFGQRTFDLATGPLFQINLIKLDDQEHILVLTYHHIISDGWSNGVLIQELTQLYKKYTTGNGISLPDLPIQYADYAVWQREWLKGNVLAQQIDYWTQRLKGAPPLLELPIDYPRPPVQSYRGAIKHFQLTEEVSSKLKQLSHQNGVTLFMVLVAAYKTLLYRLTEQEDLSVGFPVANRNRSEIEGLIGFFVNTLVLRTDLSGNPTFQEFLQQVKDVSIEAYSNQDVPFEKLVEELQPERNRAYSPLCQVVFALQNESRTTVDCQDVTMTFFEIECDTSKFDLTFFVEERGDQLIGNVEYSTDLFKPETIDQMITQYITILENVAEQPTLRLREIPMGPVSERIADSELDELFS